jgi:RimJ/RimL family protein N-acetyltransferase
VNPKKVFTVTSHIIANIQRITSEIRYGFQVLRFAALRKGLKGLLSTLFKMIQHKTVGSPQLVFAQELSDSEVSSVPEVPNYRISSFLSADEIDETLRGKLIQNQHYIYPGTEKVLTKGGHLWVGYLGGQLANLACTRAGDRVGLFFLPMTAECVFISHCVTLPPYRGRGLFPAILRWIVHTLGIKGFKRFYIACNDWNLPSVHAICRAGFHLIGRGKYKRKDRLVWYQESPDFTRLNRRKKVR